MLKRTAIGSPLQRWMLLLVLVLALVVMSFVERSQAAVTAQADTPETAESDESDEDGASLSGRLADPLGEPVHDAEVWAFVNGGHEPAGETTSQDDGSYLLDLPQTAFRSVVVRMVRPHFESVEIALSQKDIAQLSLAGSLRLPDTELPRRITPGFWLATISFVLVLALIALERLHKTTAALLGVSLILGGSVVAGAIRPDFYVYDVEQALGCVDFDVIFLVMGMMIVIAVIEETGIFQWMAYQAYRLSHGKMWLLVTILIAITAVASALLDNVTTMLLMAPITVQIAHTVGINPLSLLIPEVMASNVGGISTLIGTPTNILIGSYAGLGFNDFLVNLTPGVVIALVALTIYVVLRYRKEITSAGNQLSDAMRDRLREVGRITEPNRLRKAGLIFAVILLMFVLGDAIGLEPAVVAIIGAVAMLLWVSPDIEEMLRVVDWTTLVFFIALFMTVGALQEVGVISLIAAGIGDLVGDNLNAAILVVVWSAALLSGVVDNIPFTAAMLPVVDFLTRSIPGAQTNVLWYSLSIGAAMGGNSTLIGASPNLVTAGISERAGYPISYRKFLVIGFPAMIITVLIGTAWLFIRF